MSTETLQQDWSACEITDGQEERQVEPFIPEQAAQVLVKTEQAVREQEFSKYRKLAEMFVPKDDAGVTRCGILVESCKLAAKNVEAEREKELEPHAKEVKRINSERIPVRDFFLEMAKSVTERVNKFLDDRRKAVEAEQQRLIAEANAKQALLDQQAKEARDKAAAAIESGDTVSAAKLEGKADQLEQKASEVVPMQAALPSRKVELEGSTVSFGGAKKIWSLVGWADRKKPLKVTDPALAKLVGNLDELPPGVRFILQHADLNPVYLNKSFGVIPFPEPFTTINDYSKSTVR